MRKQIFSHPASASHQKLNKLNFSSDTDEEKMKGNEAMRTSTTMINMSPPLSNQSYNDINLRLYNVYEKAAKESMSVAVNDLKKKENV